MLNIFSPQTSKGEVIYAITFSDLSQIPDLESSDEVMSQLTINLKNATSYVVASDINDKKLKELLMKHFDLKAGQVFVTSRRFM